MFERATYPPGVAPVAGHVDDHGGWEDAARAEVAEELGLTVTSLTHVAGGWRTNRCRRQPGQQGVGHEWRVYRATATGVVTADIREARNVGWVTPTTLTELVVRTTMWAAGQVTAREFTQEPGLEPVWAQWLADTGLVTCSPAMLSAIETLTEGHPDRMLT